jgi:NAD(P)-dependent dehydrogenase (short-subunit alcohol dehydrogenase family)
MIKVMERNNSMNRLTGKHVLITGAARGIGAKIAQVFAQEGARVIIADVLSEEGYATVARIQELGGQATFMHADVSQEQQVIWLMEAVINSLGSLHVLVTTPGIWHHRDTSLVDMPLAVWQEVLGVNLQGPFLCAKYALPQMITQQQGGSLIFVTSPLAHGGKSQLPPQDASITATGGLLSLSRSIATQFRRYQIRSNALVVGPALLTKHASALSTEQEQNHQATRSAGIHRIHPSVMALVALSFAEQTPDFVTGQEMIIGVRGASEAAASRCREEEKA